MWDCVDAYVCACTYCDFRSDVATVCDIYKCASVLYYEESVRDLIVDGNQREWTCVHINTPLVSGLPLQTIWTAYHIADKQQCTTANQALWYKISVFLAVYCCTICPGPFGILIGIRPSQNWKKKVLIAGQNSLSSSPIVKSLSCFSVFYTC